MALRNNVAELLDITVENLPTKVEGNPVPVVQLREKLDDSDLDGEYKKAEERLDEVLETGMRSLKRIEEIADQGEEFNEFNSVSRMMETVAKVTGERLDLTERRRALRRELERQIEEEQKPSVVNNTLVLSGTTSEILETLNEVREKRRQDK